MAIPTNKMRATCHFSFHKAEHLIVGKFDKDKAFPRFCRLCNKAQQVKLKIEQQSLPLCSDPLGQTLSASSSSKCQQLQRLNSRLLLSSLLDYLIQFTSPTTHAQIITLAKSNGGSWHTSCSTTVKSCDQLEPVP